MMALLAFIGGFVVGLVVALLGMVRAMQEIDQEDREMRDNR